MNISRQRFTVLLWVVLAIAALSLDGCAALNPFAPDPTTVSAKLHADANVNPNATGRASPTVVRVYYLTSKTAFENADFFSLYDKDAAVLGSAMLDRHEYEVNPGSTRKLDTKPPKGAAYIAALAAYQDISGARWQATYAIKPHQDNRITINVGADAVSITATND